MTVSAIVQARVSSTRLPGKVLLPAPDGRPLLAVMIERIKQTTLVDQIIVATTENPEDDALVTLAEECEVASFRGPTDDVLQRFYRCAIVNKSDTIVRLTGDCPFADWIVIDHLVAKVQSSFWDYAKTHASYPEGLDAEAFTKHALSLAQRGARTAHDREHVTPWIKRESLSKYEAKHSPHAGHIRLTLDYESDYRVIYAVLEKLGPMATLPEILALYEKEPAIFDANKTIERNEWEKQGITV